MLVMTIDQVPGHRVRRILGEVIGVTIKSDNPYVEGVKSLDGNGDERVGQLIQTRQEAVANMIEYARRLGANAIVGMRFDHRTIAGGYNEICAYGTGLVIAPASRLGRGATS